MDKETAVLVLHRDGVSINKIYTQLNISRNTVRKIIRNQDIEHVPKKYQRVHPTHPKLQEYIHQLDQMLLCDLVLPRKEKRSAQRYYVHLQSSGYSGSYDSVRRYVQKWQQKKGKAATDSFIPLAFDPGEAYQFDWSEESVNLAGRVTKVKVGHFRLSYSRMFFIVAYMRETQDMLFDAHDKAFEFFEGITKRGIYDNMKTAVDKVFVSKYNRTFNQHFLCLMKHYVIEPTACNPASGWEKGQVENQVDNVRDWLFKPKIHCNTIEELNDHLLKETIKICHNRKHPDLKDQTIHQVFIQEKSHLRSFVRPFSGYSEEMRLVNSVCMINYDTNCYSVDCAYANNKVEVRVYPNQIIVMANGQKISEHVRCFERYKKIFNPYHYLSLLERKPGALRNGSPFKDWDLPKSILQVKEILMSKNGGDKGVVDILLALRDHGSEVVEVACDLAISDGVVNSSYILNAINRLECEENAPPIEIDKSLELQTPPLADCERYNKLLKQEVT
jgi:transposase